VSAVLFLQRSERLFALTFGFGRHLLDTGALEPGFGLKVAAGLVDPEGINAVDSRLVQATRLQVRRQAGRGMTPRSIGLDIGREMLRALSGRTLDGTLGTRVTGADALGLAATLGVRDVLDRLDRFLDAHQRKLYQERFPLLDRWRAVTDAQTRERLDGLLSRALATEHRRLDIAVPEIIDWSGAGFSFSREERGTRHAFPSLDDYRATLADAPTLIDVRRDRMTLHSADSDSPVGQWNIYRTLEWETNEGERVYFLAEGRWFEVAADFLARVDERIAAIDRTRVPGPDFDPREWEVDYNRRLAAYAPDRAFLDRKLAYFDDESGTVEICDVFTAQREFIHIKRDFRTEDVSQQLAQGSVSADLFTNRPEHRHRLREFLGTGTDLAAVVPDGILEHRQFGVAYGIITREPERVPEDLPVFARIHLSQIADLIERLGFRISVFGIPTTAGARPPDLGPTSKEIAEERKRQAAAAA
jgi:uncharacterized protein (TIGR04141 family)